MDFGSSVLVARVPSHDAPHLPSAPQLRGCNPVAGEGSITGEYAHKRLYDLVLAICSLVLLAPLLALIWLLVRATSRGPGLYWSVRVGRYGQLFDMPKFRTMFRQAPLRPREMLETTANWITPLGALLRRYSLDELPQLACIIRGDMSFVGPRPLLLSDPGHEARKKFPVAMRARPGLSGIAQIAGRNCLSSRRKARLDAFYARAASPAVDMRIMLRTASVVLDGKGFI